jgi:hypothetical protein
MPLNFEPVTDPDFSDPADGAVLVAIAARARVSMMPTQINGDIVIAAVPASSLDSSIVHVVAVDPTKKRRAYVVWDAWRDTEGVWRAQNGHYDIAGRSDALGVLVKRLGWTITFPGDTTTIEIEEDPL